MTTPTEPDQWIIDTTDGGLYRDEYEYDPLPDRIGPFLTQWNAEEWLVAQGPLWGSFSIALVTAPVPTPEES